MTNKTDKTATPIIRKGKACKVLPDGAPRRMADGKNAYRKMSPEQRQTFKAWINDQDGSDSWITAPRFSRGIEG